MSHRLITVAIHTFECAQSLKSLLEREGVDVTLQNVNLDVPEASAGVRVRIKESDLPLALRIIENKDLFINSGVTDSYRRNHILVPVDFSSYSYKACQLAFNLAIKHKASVVLLNSFVNPSFANRLQLADSLNFDDDVDDIGMLALAENEANKRMAEFAETILSDIKSGALPAVGFKTEVCEGIPEEVINQYAKEHYPLAIVMGTRGAGTKERELVGSVTAEVLDTCRFPIFTVPDCISFSNPDEIKQLVFFSNFDQEDVLALDALFHLLPDSSFEITLVRIPSRKNYRQDIETPLKALCEYCRRHYPTHRFGYDTLSLHALDADFDRITKNGRIDIIAVPNKKKNMFARLFNPGIAHRLLFHADIPMAVIPV